MYELHYTDRRGASVARYFQSAAELEKYLRTARLHPATIHAAGQIVGEVVRADGQWHWYFSDPQDGGWALGE